jgi:hypothetical protein
MKEPKRIPLTDNPRNKEPQKLPLTTPMYYDIEMIDDVWIKKEDENNQQNNTQSIPKLESNQIN